MKILPVLVLAGSLVYKMLLVIKKTLDIKQKVCVY